MENLSHQLVIQRAGREELTGSARTSLASLFKQPPCKRPMSINRFLKRYAMAGSFELHKPSLFLSVILFGQLREENSVPAEFTLFQSDARRVQDRGRGARAA